MSLSTSFGIEMEIAYYRNRLRSLEAFFLTLAPSGAAGLFVAWALARPESYQRMVDSAIHEGRAVLALPLSLLLTPVLMAFALIESRKAFDGRPVLVLSESGIYFRDWKVGEVPWREVSACQLVTVDPGGRLARVERRRYLQFELTNPDMHLERVHGGGSFSGEYARKYFRIPLYELKAEPEALLRQIQSRVPPPA